MCCVFCIVFAVFGLLPASTTNAATSVADSAVGIGAAAIEGCVATPGQPCSYGATQAGRYTAAGSGWTVEIYRSSGHTVYYRDDSSPNDVEAVHPGDFVTLTAGTGIVLAGPRPSVAGS